MIISGRFHGTLYILSAVADGTSYIVDVQSFSLASEYQLLFFFKDLYQHDQSHFFQKKNRLTLTS